MDRVVRAGARSSKHKKEQESTDTFEFVTNSVQSAWVRYVRPTFFVDGSVENSCKYSTRVKAQTWNPMNTIFERARATLYRAGRCRPPEMWVTTDGALFALLSAYFGLGDS